MLYNTDKASLGKQSRDVLMTLRGFCFISQTSVTNLWHAWNLKRVCVKSLMLGESNLQVLKVKCVTFLI